ncbi:hypothetical protein TA3x_005021 [Tundrisphaera sp. TA3]|uniref:hypothetical protein n=1 Tax=Tundrisphaera sp. TA3 TaxID=3435775 RepID=UPI003EC0D49A
MKLRISIGETIGGIVVLAVSLGQCLPLIRAASRLGSASSRRLDFLIFGCCVAVIAIYQLFYWGFVVPLMRRRRDRSRTRSSRRSPANSLPDRRV